MAFHIPDQGFPNPISQHSGTGYRSYGALDRRLLSFPRTAVINDGSKASPATGGPNPKALQPPVITPRMPDLGAWRGPETQTALRPQINDMRMSSLDVFDGHLAESGNVVGGLGPQNYIDRPRLQGWPRGQASPQASAWPETWSAGSAEVSGIAPGTWVPEFKN